MAQYLLSVWDTHREGSELGPYADEAEMQAAFEATDKFNQEIQASGTGSSPAACTRRRPPPSSTPPVTTWSPPTGRTRSPRS